MEKPDPNPESLAPSPSPYLNRSSNARGRCSWIRCRMMNCCRGWPACWSGVRSWCALEHLTVWSSLRRPHARRQLVALRACPAGAGFERFALQAAVQIHATLGAAAIARDRQRQQIAAARAAADLVRRHQIRGLRSRGVLQLTSGCAILLRRARRGRAFRTARLVLVLISALSVLSIAHMVSGRTRLLRTRRR